MKKINNEASSRLKKKNSSVARETYPMMNTLKEQIEYLEGECFALKNLIDNLPGDIYWKNKEGVWTGVNKQGVESLKKMGFIKTSADVIGKTDFQIFDKTTAEQYRYNDLEVMNSKAELTREETTRLAGGDKIIQLSVKRPLWDKEGNIAGIVGNTIDITKLKKIESELNIAKEKAEAASKAKTAFLENMRHDIRTPLSGIVGFSDLIKAEAQNPRVKEYADNLMASSHALLDLMDEVLEAVRVNSGEIPLVKKKFSLQRTLQHVIDLNLAKAASKRLDLSFEYDNTIPKYVIGDNVRLHRVVLELIANALNFTDSGFVRLKVKCAKHQGRELVIKIVVSDSGIGIPKDKQQEIFLQFRRLTPSYEGIYKGAGLGLAVIKQFVDDMSGEIYVDSSSQKGAVFTCILPLQEPLLTDDVGVDEMLDLKDLSMAASAMHQSLPATGDDIKTPGEYHILVVEDNIVAQAVVKNLLVHYGCHIDIAPDGKEALHCWKNNNYDLIFMDIGLPDMDGYEITHLIRAQELAKKMHTPIIALTAHAADDSKQRCIEAGMNAVLTKPLTLNKCRDILEAFIPSKQQQKDESRNTYFSDLPGEEESLFKLSNFPILDIKEGIKTTGNEETLAQMLEIMLKQPLLEDVSKIKKAHDKGEWEAAQALAHKIKGGAVYIGAVRLRMACQYFERYWKTGQRDLLEELYQQVLKTINESIKEITTWLHKRE